MQTLNQNSDDSRKDEKEEKEEGGDENESECVSLLFPFDLDLGQKQGARQNSAMLRVVSRQNKDTISRQLCVSDTGEVLFLQLVFPISVFSYLRPSFIHISTISTEDRFI